MVRTLLALLLLAAGIQPAFGDVSPELQRRIRASTFEVVMKKPLEEAVRYEKPLPLELLPYIERTDRYRSVGTAFAIGPNRFVTAAHVLIAGIGSQFGAPALRSSSGAVHPIANILKFSAAEDFVEFSLTEPLNVVALPTNRSPQLDDAVLAVGNALGEGVVVRDGLFTSQTAEEQDGRWKWIRFSAAASPGNSGGPLLDATGRIIGVVIAKSPNENLNYALPIANVLDAPPLKARFDQRTLTRLPFAQASQTYTLKDEFALPLSWDKFNQTYLALMSRHNDEARAALLSSHADSFFPHGEDSEAILYSSQAASRVPGLVLQQADGKWVVEAPPLTFTDLPGDGKVGVTAQGEVRMLALHRGDEASDDAFYGDSKAFMDIALKALNLRRQVGTDQVRVDSLGAATLDETTTDAWGRRWQLRAWPVPFLDVYVVAKLLPTPDGYVGLLVSSPSISVGEAKAQLALLGNQAMLTYEGTTQQWQAFLARRALLPDAFKDVKLQSSPLWNLHTARFDFGAPVEFLSIDAHSELLVSMSYAFEGAKVAWGISGARWYQDAQEKVYLGLLRAPKPPATAKLETRTRFEDLHAGHSPYDGSPVQATSDAVDVQLGLPAPGDKEGTAAADVAYGIALRLNNHPTRAQVALARASAERVIHILEHGTGSGAVQLPTVSELLPVEGRTPEAQALARSFDLKGRDIRGRVMSDDYRQFVEPLLNKSDPPDSKAVVADLVQVLTDYWNVAPGLVSNREVWPWFLFHNNLPDKTPHGREVLVAETALRDLVGKGGAPNAQWTARTRELRDLYVSERKSMALEIASRAAASARYQSRLGACPAPAAQTSGEEKPRLAQTPHSLQEFYPPVLLGRAVEGTVVVWLKVDTAGCPTDFAIAASSGDDAFDEAALKWVETTSFLPGERAGRAIASTKPLAVVFALTTG